MMAVKPTPPATPAASVLFAPGRLDHAGDPRDGAAEEHGAQHNPFDVHTRIRGRRLAFPDHADLISLLGVCHVNEHQHHQHQRDDPTDMYAENPVERRVV